MRRTVAKLAVCVLAGALPLAGAITTQAHAGSASDLLGLVNHLRATLGLGALAPDSALDSVAQRWSQSMASSNTLSHNPSLSSQVPSGWTKVGENVGTGGSIQVVFNALVASPGHYANMVDPAFTTVGTGTATAANGAIYVTQDFMARRSSSAPAPAPAAPAPAPAPKAAPKAVAAPAPKATAAPARQVAAAAPRPAAAAPAAAASPSTTAAAAAPVPTVPPAPAAVAPGPAAPLSTSWLHVSLERTRGVNPSL